MSAITLDMHDIRETLTKLVTKELRLPKGSVATNLPFTQYGLDSISALTIAGDLEDMLGLELPATLLWDCPTIDDLAKALTDLVAPN